MGWSWVSLEVLALQGPGPDVQNESLPGAVHAQPRPPPDGLHGPEGSRTRSLIVPSLGPCGSPIPSIPCPVPTPQQSHRDHLNGGKYLPLFNLVVPACGSHHMELGPAHTQGKGRVKTVTELALLLLIPCRPSRTPLLQSGTTEWFHMKKQHLKPMVKVSSQLCLSEVVINNLLGLGWEAQGIEKSRLR